MEQEPTQKKSPLPPEQAAKLENAAEQVIRDKFGKKRKFCEIHKSILSGRINDRFQVTVTTDSFLMNIEDPVETDIGIGKINTIYPSKEEGTLRVSVEFDWDMTN